MWDDVRRILRVCAFFALMVVGILAVLERNWFNAVIAFSFALIFLSGGV